MEEGLGGKRQEVVGEGKGSGTLERIHSPWASSTSPFLLCPSLTLVNEYKLFSP